MKCTEVEERREKCRKEKEKRERERERERDEYNILFKNQLFTSCKKLWKPILGWRLFFEVLVAK